MKDGCQISVILPVYNGERYLHQAINSILNQSYSDFELIIINDGSTDKTESIITSYTDPRIIYIKNEENLKLIKTLNKGIGLAKGQYISRMDADDIAAENLFEKQLATFNSDPSIDIVNIQTYELTEDGNLYRPFIVRKYLDNKSLKYIELFENHITHPGIMVKSELMKKYLYKDDGSVINFEDVDLWIRMLWDGAKCVTINDRLLYYRINNSSVTRIIGKSRNILRVNYVNALLFQKFAISVDPNALYYLYGEVKDGCCNPYDIDKIIEVISKQMNGEEKKHFYEWYRLRMCVVSMQIIRHERLKYKLKSFSYMICRSFSTGFIKYIIFKLSNKWIPYENSCFR